MATVVFDYDEFLIRFPHIAQAVTAGTLTEDIITSMYDYVAEWLGDSDSNSLYPYNPDKGIYMRKSLLYLATCHIITISYLWSGGQTGKITSASQGSVSTSFDSLKANSVIGDWWLQTPCGSQFWIMSAPYRKGGRFYGVPKYHPYG